MKKHAKQLLRVAKTNILESKIDHFETPKIEKSSKTAMTCCQNPHKRENRTSKMKFWQHVIAVLLLFSFFGVRKTTKSDLLKFAKSNGTVDRRP